MRWGRRSLVLGAMILWNKEVYSIASAPLLTIIGRYWSQSIPTGLYRSLVATVGLLACMGA